MKLGAELVCALCFLSLFCNDNLYSHFTNQFLAKLVDKADQAKFFAALMDLALAASLLFLVLLSALYSYSIHGEGLAALGAWRSSTCFGITGLTLALALFVLRTTRKSKR